MNTVQLRCGRTYDNIAGILRPDLEGTTVAPCNNQALPCSAQPAADVFTACKPRALSTHRVLSAESEH